LCLFYVDAAQLRADEEAACADLVLPSPQCEALALHVDVAPAGSVGVAGAPTAGLIAAASCVPLHCLPRLLNQGRVGGGADLSTARQGTPGRHVAGAVDAGGLRLGAHSSCNNQRAGRQLVVQAGDAGVIADRAGWCEACMLAHCRAAAAGCLKLCDAALGDRACFNACRHAGCSSRHSSEDCIVQGEARACWCWQLAVAGHAGLWASGIAGKGHAHADIGVPHVVIAAVHCHTADEQ
jgi:hypothetical protein